MVEGASALFAVKGEHFQGAVLVENGAQVAQLAVYLAGTGSLVQAGAQALDDFHHRDAIFKFLDRSVFQCYMNHSVSSPFSDKIKKSSTPKIRGEAIKLHGSTRIADAEGPPLAGRITHSRRRVLGTEFLGHAFRGGTSAADFSKLLSAGGSSLWQKNGDAAGLLINNFAVWDFAMHPY